MASPAFQFYPGDWLRDTACCSGDAVKLWARMLCLAHDRKPYGHLAVNGRPMPDEMVAEACGVTTQVYRRLLAELDSHDVPQRTEDGVIYCPMLVDRAKRRAADAERKRLERERRAGRSECDIRVTSAVTSAGTSTTCPQDNGDGVGESLSCGLGGAGGKGPIDGDPWGKPIRVPVADIRAEAERREAARRPVNPHLAEANAMLREFGFNASNAAKYAASLNATPERVRWLCSEAKRLAETGKITEPMGFVIAGIRSAKDPDPGPSIQTPEAQLDAVLARRSA